VAGINSIVVGVDGSDSSRAALRWAHDEAAHHGASLTVVTAWHLPPLPMTPPFGSLTEEGYGDQPRKNALGVLEDLVAGLEAKEPAVDVRTSIAEGSPAKVLIERSSECDLMVVGSRGLEGFTGMLLGSVSQHVVAHAQCPVVVVK
jgi:nucleotide-binding universal stress UspA family protein